MFAKGKLRYSLIYIGVSLQSLTVAGNPAYQYRVTLLRMSEVGVNTLKGASLLLSRLVRNADQVNSRTFKKGLI